MSIIRGYLHVGITTLLMGLSLCSWRVFIYVQFLNKTGWNSSESDYYTIAGYIMCMLDLTTTSDEVNNKEACVYLHKPQNSYNTKLINNFK